MIAGSATILIHPLFYFLPMGAFLLVRKHLGRAIALGGLPFLWVGYEYSHMLSEWSFPWLTLGNSQTYSLAQIQYVSVTGVLGVSFWIVVLNVILLQVISVMMAERGPTRQKQLVAWSAIFVVTAILPTIQGTLVLSSASEVPIAGKAMTVGMVQTNADPWEKWTGNDWGVIAGLEEMTDSLLHESRVRRPDLILWPETAIPVYLLAPENAALYRRFRRWVDTSDISLLSGLLQVVVYPDSTRAPRGAKRTRGGGLWYETFNAEALFTSDIDKVPWYGKMKMVPLAFPPVGRRYRRVGRRARHRHLHGTPDGSAVCLVDLLRIRVS
jgi:apolipoprotein N-acyltransferase